MSTLELEDAVYEKALNKTLFEYVRAGQLDSAIDLARQADRSWRAASLRGASLYWRPGLNDDMEEIKSTMGNRNRTLWKAVCRSLCSKTTVDEYERGLYGALSGDLKSVLAVSTSWESQLWAYTNARLEALIDDKLDKSGLWWGQDAGTHFGIPSNIKEQGAVRLNELSIPNVLHDLGEQSQLKDVFLNLSQSNHHSIQTQAEHPFRIVQRAVILSDVPRLLEYIDSRLPVIKADSSPRQYARIVRFFAHLTLYLRLLNWDPMPDLVVCNSILKAYVQILEGLGEDDLVALYASSLEAESATESYAHYLKCEWV
jgi:nuclear pore complex protein Nup107